MLFIRSGHPKQQQQLRRQPQDGQQQQQKRQGPRQQQQQQRGSFTNRDNDNSNCVTETRFPQRKEFILFLLLSLKEKNTWPNSNQCSWFSFTSKHFWRVKFFPRNKSFSFSSTHANYWISEKFSLLNCCISRYSMERRGRKYPRKHKGLPRYFSHRKSETNNAQRGVGAAAHKQV